MIASYCPLYGLNLHHAFYESGRNRQDFEVQPSAQTARDLAGAGLVLKPDGGDFTVYAEVVPDSDPVRLLRAFGENSVRHVFYLHSVNAHLLTISDLPEHEVGGSVFYYDNLRADMDGDLALLGDSVTDGNPGDPVALICSQSLRYRFASPVQAATITVRDIFTNVVHTESLYLTDATSEWNFALDLAPGYYILTDDQSDPGANHNQRIYYDPALFGRRPLAVVAIYNQTTGLTTDHTDRVPVSYRYLSEGGGDVGRNIVVRLPAYGLRLAPRATVWRYSVIHQGAENGISLDELKIIGDVDFDDPVIETDRVVFTSAEPVLLRNKPRTLMLAHKNSDLGSLQCPTATTSLELVAGADSFISHMYVYV